LEEIRQVITNDSIQSQDTDDLAENAFEHFINSELAPASLRFGNSEAEIYMYCHLAPEGEPSRRLLVVTDKQSAIIRVCIEAAYELFAGDIHHYVNRVGTVNRDEADEKLIPLVREAYDRLIAWKPSHENIWDNVY
jgi:hypothetical protein